MSYSMLRTCTRAAASLFSTSGKTMLPMTFVPQRNASKKAGGAVRNPIGKKKTKTKGIKIRDGSFIYKGDVIATQFVLKYYPGENVLIDSKNTLTAALDGVLVYSTEVLSPYPDSPLYEAVQNGSVLQRRFLNIIPTPLHGKFRLVSET